MNHVVTTPIPNPTSPSDAFLRRIFLSLAGFFDIVTIYIGDRLGFYAILARGEWMSSTELATQAGTQERYTREWLEQQTVVGILEVADDQEEPLQRRFRLPAAHREALVGRESRDFLAPLAQSAVGAMVPIHKVLQAYRGEGGVSTSDDGADLREGQAGRNRHLFLHELGRHHLPQISDVHARLQANPPARIADIGCGVGWSSIGMALAYPNVRVDGFDVDACSIEDAWCNAHLYALTDRVTFHVRDGGDASLNGRYDLVTAFASIHDLGDPVGVLRTMRRLAGGQGAVVVMEGRVGDTFTAKGNDVEWMMYGWSVLHGPAAGSGDQQPSAATGTVLRAETLTHYALQAGFQRVEVLPIENFFYRFYRLHG